MTSLSATARPAAVLPGMALAGMGSIAFSGKAIIVKLAYRHGVDAVTLIMLRMAFALPLFLLLAWWAGRGRPVLSGADWRRIGLLGFSGYYLASWLDFEGLRHISASLERLILYLNPTVVAGLGWLLYGRRIVARQFIALGLSYVGVILVFGHELHFGGSGTAIGAALVFGSTLSYAAYMVGSGQLVGRIGALRLTGLATSVACGFCIAQFTLLRPMASLATVATPVLWLSLLNASLCTFAPVLMVMMAIERVGPAMTAQTGMVGPLSTIAMGVLILGEPFTPWIAAGTVFVLAGITMLARTRS
jgi:drug/metabolite transporter (DMT)-like permease